MNTVNAVNAPGRPAGSMKSASPDLPALVAELGVALVRRILRRS